MRSVEFGSMHAVPASAGAPIHSWPVMRAGADARGLRRHRLRRDRTVPGLGPRPAGVGQRAGRDVRRQGRAGRDDGVDEVLSLKIAVDRRSELPPMPRSGCELAVRSTGPARAPLRSWPNMKADIRDVSLLGIPDLPECRAPESGRFPGLRPGRAVDGPLLGGSDGGCRPTADFGRADLLALKQTFDASAIRLPL